jgi:hypothetical protein
LKYYKDIKDYKGSINLDHKSVITKVGRNTIKLTCVKKEKEYTLLQAQSDQISFIEEKKKGYIFNIDEWIKEMNKVVEHLKY